MRRIQGIFLGSLDEQIQYCFSIYDLNADGYISKEEMLTMLKTCLVRQGLEEDGDEGVKDLIEMTLKKMDDDKECSIFCLSYALMTNFRL